MHIVHLQGAVKGGELLSLDEPMMIEVFFLLRIYTCIYIYTLYLVYHYTVYLDYTVYTLQWLEWKGATNSVSIHSLHDRFNSLYNQTTDSESIRLSHMVHLEAL